VGSALAVVGGEGDRGAGDVAVVVKRDRPDTGRLCETRAESVRRGPGL
jgi:hypothetical protein